MLRKTIPISNVVMMIGAQQKLQERAPGTPGIGLIYGPSGYGKTSSLAFMRNKINGVYVRAWPTWTPSSMLSTIMLELGLQPNARIHKMIDAIVQALSMEGRTLFIDEGDYLTDKLVLLEVLRSLHDVSTSPLILVGMEEFKQKVMHREQLAGRIGQWVEFQPASPEDASMLAHGLCEVEIGADLVSRLYEKSKGGSVRRIVSGLWNVEAFARKKGIRRVSLAEWGDRAFSFGEPPSNISRAA